MIEIDKKLLETIQKRSMLGLERIKKNWENINIVLENNIEGDIVECGTFKGGCLALLTYASKDSNKRVFGFDSFEGLPPPTEKDGEKSKNRFKKPDKLAATIQDCKDTFDMIPLSYQNVSFVKGFFSKEGFESQNIEKICYLRLDGDWYESTKICLESLYDKLSIGGCLVIDDYGHWEGCKKALDEFIEKKNISINDFVKSDYTEIFYFKKEENL
jgi:O-methyltransferase